VQTVRIRYENYKGGINNLCVVESGNVITTSTKGKGVAIKNHIKKLKQKEAEAAI